MMVKGEFSYEDKKKQGVGALASSHPTRQPVLLGIKIRIKNSTNKEP